MLGATRRLFSLVAVAAVIVPAAALAATRPASAASSAQVDVGYNGFILAGRAFPVRVTVQADRLVRGRIEVTSVITNGPRNSLTVRLPVELPGGGAKKFLLVVPGQLTDGMTASVTARLIANRGGVLAQSGAADAKIADERELVGVLPGARRGAEVPGPVPLAIPAGVAEFHAIGSAELAAAPAALEPLGTVLAGGGDLAAMSDRTRRRFLAWLERGGTLLVDAPVGATVAGLPAEWQPGPTGQHQAGLGLVVAAAEQFASGNWANTVFPTANAVAADVRLGPFGGSRLVAQTLAEDAGVRVPKLGWLLLFLVVYTVIVGPVIGFVLHRAGRAELAWVLIPVVAVVFTAGSWVTARGLQSRRQAAHATIVEQSPAGARLTSFVGLAATGGTDVDVGLRDGAWAALLPSSTFDQAAPVRVEVGEDGPAAHLRLSSGQFGVAALTGPTTADGGLTLTATSAADGSAQGVVRNTSKVALEKVAVMVGDHGTLVGALAPGEQTDWLLASGGDQAQFDGDPFASAESNVWGGRFERFPNDGDSAVTSVAAWQSASPLAGTSRPAGLAVAVGWSKAPASPIELDGRSRGRVKGRTAFSASTPVIPSGRITDMTVRGQLLRGQGFDFAGGRRDGGASIVRFVLPDGSWTPRPLMARVAQAQRIEAWVSGKWVALGEAANEAGGEVPEGQVDVGGGIRIAPAPMQLRPGFGNATEVDVPPGAVTRGQVFLRLTNARGPLIASALALWERA